MVRLVVRRLLTVLPMLLGVVLFTFVLIRLSGQDPVMKLAGPTATTQEIALVRQGLGLDQPIPTQLVTYLKQARGRGLRPLVAVEPTGAAGRRRSAFR